MANLKTRLSALERSAPDKGIRFFVEHGDRPGVYSENTVKGFDYQRAIAGLGGDDTIPAEWPIYTRADLDRFEREGYRLAVTRSVPYGVRQETLSAIDTE